MARFSTVAKGARARTSVDLALLDGTAWRVDVTPLIGAQEADVAAGARAYAKAQGIDDPRVGQPEYEYGVYLHTLLVACLDADEQEKRVRAFDSIEQILDRDTGLDRDRIVYLFEAQQRFQDTCSFRKRGLDMREYIEAVVAHSRAPEDAEELPFERWAPATRRHYVRTMAVQLVSLYQLKSPNGPGTADETTSSSSSSEPSAPLAVAES